MISEYNNRNTQVFSALDGDEETVLLGFYNYVQRNPNRTYVGWNFKGVTYGPQILERRYQELFGKKPPRINSVLDLDDVIESEYGKLYVDHGDKGKMYNLFTLNDISTLDFLGGMKEAELCEKNDIRPVEQSTDRKVRGMMNILDFLINRNLKTTRKTIKHHMLQTKIHNIENSSWYRLAAIVVVLIAVITAVIKIL
ncbi:hypothetical protein P0O24_08235 [Methanotrichaceae archaeon M04Ac]|uniref:Uncharacterized protein n=1 Tax=Candidatus Methanocrinis alkalitolerans TaxID=3033395 RepID=A0ABT5XFS7_9EURY|nr:hypothetical protein [Candidatus Methanocrinis alkalitolerans]MDF0593568.1 hypothetical protein [Candidatus Methanocrinis alkalitolerans]